MPEPIVLQAELTQNSAFLCRAKESLVPWMAPIRDREGQEAMELFCTGSPSKGLAPFLPP